MNKLKHIALGMFAVIAIASCNNASNSGKSNHDSTSGASGKLNQLTNTQDTGTLHLYFHLLETAQTDSSVIYEAKSLSNEDTVGLKVEVLKGIAAGITATGAADEQNGFREGAIKLSSLGTVSDNFVKAIGDLMAMPTDGKMTDKTLLPLVFSSNKDKVDLNKAGTYSFKYFFENGTGTPAEMFGVVDTYKKSFELTEKNKSYRSAIIATFEGK